MSLQRPTSRVLIGLASLKVGRAPGPSPFCSGSRRSLSVDVGGLIKQLYMPLDCVFEAR